MDSIYLKAIVMAPMNKVASIVYKMGGFQSDGHFSGLGVRFKVS
jgi:hypothetical protein